MLKHEILSIYREQLYLAKTDVARIQEEGWRELRTRNGQEPRDVTNEYLRRQQRIIDQLTQLIEAIGRDPA